MSGRTFGVQASWDEVLRLLDIDIPQSELNKAIGVADSMNQQIEEFLNRFVVSATNDDGDLTFDAAGTYTFEGDVALTGDLTLLGAGVVRTAASGVRAEMSPDAAFVGGGTVSGIDHAGLLFYTDDAAEVAPGGIGGGLFQIGADQWATVTVQSPDMGAPNLPASQVAVTAGPDVSRVLIDANEFGVTLWNTNNVAVNGSFGGSNDTNGTLWSLTGQQLLVDTDNAVRPFYSWWVDTDTGMYRKSANQLGFTTGGTSRFYISGNQMFSQVNGSSAAPPYSFTNDKDAGMRLRGAGELSIQAASNRQIRMKAEASNMTIFVDDNAGGGVLQGVAASNNDVRYDPSNGRIFYNTSSLRFKENVVPEPGRPDLPVLPHLAHYYDIREEYKTGDSLTDGRIYGPIAEILFSVHPELVSLDEKNRPDSPNSLHILTFLWDRVRALEIAMTRSDMIVS